MESSEKIQAGGLEAKAKDAGSLEAEAKDAGSLEAKAKDAGGHKSGSSDAGNLTEGGILKKLLMVALPIMGTQFMQMAYNLTDMFWLGRTDYAVMAVAASGLAGLYMWLSAAPMLLGRTGAEIGTAQNLGKRKPGKARDYAQDSVRIALILGIVCGAIFIIFPEPLISLLKVQEPTVYQNSVRYLRIIGAAVPFFYVSASITGIFNGAGNSKISFKANAVGLLVNMVLDPLMILYFGWGVTGAAVATSLAEIVVFVQFIIFIKHPATRPFSGFRIFGGGRACGRQAENGGRAYARHFTPQSSEKDLPGLHKSLLGLRKRRSKIILWWGTPLALESAAFTILSMVVTAMAAAWYGEMAVAINRVGSQIESLSWMVGIGFSSAMTAFVGQNYGAKKWNRIRRSFKIATAALLIWELFVTFLLVAFGGFFFSLFLREPPEIIGMGAVYLKIMAICLVFLAFEGTCSGAFRGLGKTLPPSICSIGANLLRPILCWRLHLIMGMNGLWLGISLSAALRGLSMLIWYILSLHSWAGSDNLSYRE